MHRLLVIVLGVSASVNVWLWIALSNARKQPTAAYSATVAPTGQLSREATAAAATTNGSGASEEPIRELARLRNENTLLRQQMRQSTNTAPPARPFRRVPADADINEKFAAATNALSSAEKWATAEYDKRNSLIEELAEASPEKLLEIKQRAESRQCIQYLKQIALAARIYGNDNEEKTPPDYWSMRNEISSPKILFCPSASGGVQARDWQHFNPGSATYAWRGAGVDMRNPNSVFTACPYHGHTAMADGSVQSQPGQMPDL